MVAPTGSRLSCAAAFAYMLYEVEYCSIPRQSCRRLLEQARLAEVNWDLWRAGMDPKTKAKKTEAATAISAALHLGLKINGSRNSSLICS